jgi:hypothetical protein
MWTLRPNQEGKMKLAVFLFICCLSILPACANNRDLCAAQKEIPQTECDALVAFYNQTGGPHWKDQRGWLQDPDPCNWFGIGCTDGHVTSISINYNELEGILPAELSQLEEIELISLYYNHLSGGIPPELGQLSELHTLIIHNNDLSGELPPELGAMSSLKKLDLDGNQFGGPIPAEFGDLSSLLDLKLRGNQLTG